MGCVRPGFDSRQPENIEQNLLEKDPDFYDPYLYVAAGLRKLGEEAEARRFEDEVFARALARIKDQNGHWPDELLWGYLENRHIIRALGNGAYNLWRDGRLDETLEIYRQLLRSNLNDNIGARYAIVALSRGLTYEQYMAELWPKPTMPADHTEDWFNKYAPQYSEELMEWKQYCIEELGMNEKEFPS